MYRQAMLTARVTAIIFDTIIQSVIAYFIGAVLFRNTVITSEHFVTVYMLTGFTYNWFFWTRNNGQTPAKALLGIQVLKTNGDTLNTIDALMRYFGYLMNTSTFLIGWLMAFFTESRRGLHDHIAGTMVVYK
jgi:uncharacterized RDD family membrane protein YckC